MTFFNNTPVFISNGNTSTFDFPPQSSLNMFKDRYLNLLNILPSVIEILGQLGAGYVDPVVIRDDPRGFEPYL